jgi:hypothetical protein
MINDLIFIVCVVVLGLILGAWLEYKFPTRRK